MQTMTKIEALEKTIYNLENNVYEYNWGQADSCNCGILAKTLLNGKWQDSGYGDAYVKGKQLEGWDCFSDRTHCLMTGEILPKVFDALRKTEFTDSEMKDLEFLKNKQILKKANVEHLQHNKEENLITYLKAWVELLKELQEVKECDARDDDSKEKAGNTKEIIRYVSVPESITKGSKELVLN